jgi:hypothetical protein
VLSPGFERYVSFGCKKVADVLIATPLQYLEFCDEATKTQIEKRFTSLDH